MGVVSLICMVLLIDHAAAAQSPSKQDFIRATDGLRYSNHSLDCGQGRRVLVLDAEIVFFGAPCCRGASCVFYPSAADFQRYLAACGNTSPCRLAVQDPQQCDGTTASPRHALVTYECSSAPAVLAMDRPGSTSGRTVAAGFSSPDLQSSNSSWQCIVEASDCSNLTSTVELLIRNTKQQSSSFFSSGNVERLGGFLLQRNVTTSLTPFSVTLHLVEGSRVQPAYVLVTAAANVTMTCGRRAAILPEPFCDQCASSPCQEEFDCVNLPGSFLCQCPDNHTCEDVDECSNDTSPCDVTEVCNNTMGSFQCSCRHGYRQGVHDAECQEPPPQTSVVGLAVGVSLAALVVIVLIVIIACFCRKRSRKKQNEDVSLRSLETNPQQGCPNNAYEEVRLSGRNSQHRDSVGPAPAMTSESDSPYDVLFQKRPTADKKRDVIYGHLGMKGSPHDNVEDKDTCAGNTTGPGVTPHQIYFTLEPESPAAQTKVDDGSNLKVEVKPAAPQNGGGEGRLAEGHQRAEVKGAESDLLSRM